MSHPVATLPEVVNMGGVMDAWQTKSAAELGRDIAAGKADPVDLAERYLGAAETHEHGARIYARLTRERALAEAGAARRRAKDGARVSPLDGVPVSWKDLFDTSGVVTEAGSKLLEDRVPERDARVLRNATSAGLVCLGKTHMSELAFSGLGYNPCTATPPNVNDAGAAPGGSSSGAAASVAFGLAPAAIGSDTGGSVRLPSAWNDLVGFKPTHDRLSLDGVVPLCLRFDTVGPLVRSVEDAALLFAVMAGEEAPDLRDASLQGVRLTVLETVALEDIREAPGRAFEEAVRNLEKAGAHIERIKVPEVSEMLGFGGSLYTAEAYGLWRDVIEAAPEKMFAEVCTRFRLGAEVSAADYVARWKRLNDIRGIFRAATGQYDAVLVPTAPSVPPNLKRLQEDHDYFVTENLLALRNTRIGNLLGLCGLSLPTGVPSCGIQLMCQPGEDARLLRLGAAAETALG